MADQVNVFEGILKYYLQISLALRFDICTCSRCREAMLKILLNRFSPVYAPADIVAYKQVERELIKKHWQIIFVEVASAIDAVGKNLPHAAEEDKEKAFGNLLQKIKDDRGVDFSRYHPAILKRRIALRLVAHKAGSYAHYLRILAEDSSEYEKLFEVLTINVTEFFRDPPVWSVIRVIMSALGELRGATQEPLTFWSAGCSTGEEAYSLAILAKETASIKTPVRIYATDIDKDCLLSARAGMYDARRMEKMRDTVKAFFGFDPRGYFETKSGKYCVREDIKKMVEFRYLDLTGNEYIPNADLITCRNVFIYFTKPLQEQIVDRFYRCLKNKGYLVIGKNETLVPEAKLVFKEVDLHNRVYQRVKIA